MEWIDGIKMSDVEGLRAAGHDLEKLAANIIQSFLRHALREQLKLRFSYTDAIGDATERTVRPLSLAYFGPVWLLAAWCELRVAFRVFRLDRIEGLTVLDERFRHEAGKTLREFLQREQAWNRGKDRLGTYYRDGGPSVHDGEPLSQARPPAKRRHRRSRRVT